MKLTHPERADAAYRRMIRRTVKQGGRIRDTELKEIARSVMLRIDKQSAGLGVEVDSKTEQAINNWVAEQKDYIRALRKENKARIAKHGRGAASKMFTNRSKFASRNQLGNLQSEIASSRLEARNVNKFIWITKRDERVREEHRRKHGRIYSYKVGASWGDAFPGQGWACRCKSKPKFNKKSVMGKKRLDRDATKAYTFKLTAKIKNMAGI